jgi:hypothetical protein
MSDDITPSDAETRRARLAARRRRRHRRVWGVVAIVVVAAGAAVAAFAMTDESTAPSQLADPNAARKAVDNRLPLAAAQSTTAPRPLTHEQPLRLWVGGDSLAGSLGISLGPTTAATGVVSTLVDYKVSSGLWSNDFRNWASRASEQMAAENPEAVIFFIGANDTPMPNNLDNNGDGTADWIPGYRTKVGNMMDTFIGGDAKRTVIWIGAPTMRTDSLNDGAAELNEVMKAEAAKRAPNVVYVDAYQLFSGPDGRYSDRLTDENGENFRARISDGVHMTTAGADYLSRALFKLLDAHWHITEQAKPDTPLQWSIAEGSGEAVPGIQTPRASNIRPRRSTTPGTQTVGSSTPVTDPVPTTVMTAPPTTIAPPPPPPPEPTTVAPTTVAPPTSIGVGAPQ